MVCRIWSYCFFEIAGSIVIGVLLASSIYIWRLAIFITLIRFLYGAGMLALAILGIINAVKGEQKPLPIIGGISILH
jgi:hypothetical protein